MNNRHALHLVTATFCALAVAGCSALDLGPEPSNYVGPTTAPITPALVLPPDSPVAVPTSVPATAPATRPSSPGTAPQTAAPMELTLPEAILTAMEHNPSLRIQRLNPLISRTGEEQARAAFDPILNAQISGGRSATPVFPGRSHSPTNYRDTLNAMVSVSQFLPTGTTISGDISTSSLYSDAALTTSSLGLTVTQALLRGAGLDVNLASLREAQLDTKISQYELRGFAESLISSIEQAYWDYAFAQRQLVIYQASLELAEQQLQQTQAFIEVGRKAESERAAAEAEVALRKQNLIDAKATLATTHLRLLQLLNPPGDYWNRPVALLTPPTAPNGPLDDVEAHVAVAKQMRPDLNQARLQIRRGDIEIVRTKNGLLPQLDLFITLGKSGYSKSFGGSIGDLDNPGYDAIAGLKLDYPIGNRSASATYRRSVLTREQAAESLNNLEQLAQVDVRTAFVNVQRFRAQIGASQATRAAQEETVRTETAKFRVGSSTSLLVAQAQRDLLSAQISELQAVINYLKALTNLYAQEGSLLERRQIQAPGRQGEGQT